MEEYFTQADNELDIISGGLNVLMAAYSETNELPPTASSLQWVLIGLSDRVKKAQESINMMFKAAMKPGKCTTGQKKTERNQSNDC